MNGANPPLPVICPGAHRNHLSQLQIPGVFSAQRDSHAKGTLPGNGHQYRCLRAGIDEFPNLPGNCQNDAIERRLVQGKPLTIIGPLECDLGIYPGDLLFLQREPGQIEFNQGHGTFIKEFLVAFEFRLRLRQFLCGEVMIDRGLVDFGLEWPLLLNYEFLALLEAAAALLVRKDP